MVFLSWIRLSKNSLFLLLGVGLTSEVAWHLYKKYKYPLKKNNKIELTKKSIIDTLFFSELSDGCRSHANYNTPCDLDICPLKPLSKLLEYLSSATTSLDICVYFLTFNAIMKVLIELHRKNITIRVITDDEASENDASQIFNMRKAGMKVRAKRQNMYLMHHKFAIVDKQLLITGSANWTIQAFFGNCENILITNQKELVNAYVEEFDKIWSRYDIDYSTTIQNEKGNSV